MPPKRRSGRKSQSPAKASAVIQVELEEQADQEEHVDLVEETDQGGQADQGGPTDQGGQTDQGDEGEKEAEPTVDLTDEQDYGGEEAVLDQMLEFDSSINDTTESNGIQEDAETEIEPQLSESATSVDETATDAAAPEATETEPDDTATQDEGETSVTVDEEGSKGDGPEGGEEETSEKSDSKTTTPVKQEDTSKSSFLTEGYIKRNLVFKQYMRKEISADIRLKTVLVFPVTLTDIQDTTLLGYIEKSHRFMLNFNDRLKKHNTEGFLSISFHTLKEADEAVESLKSWREGLTVRRMHPPESVGMSPLPESIDKAMNDIKGFDPAMETHCMVFVKFLPEDTTQEALNELMPGSSSVVIARTDDGVQRNYGYLSYETAEEAKEAAEKYKDIEMDGKKLLVVHYGTYIDPVSPTNAMPDTKRIHMLHQYRNLKFNYDTKHSTMVASYKQQTEYRIEMLKCRLENDAELRVAEKKPELGLEQLPAKKPKGQDNYNNYSHVPSKLLPAPRPLATQPMKRKNKPYQNPHMGMTPRWQNQQMGGMGMGGGGMLGAGGMMGVQPEATVKAVNMLVGLLSNQLQQQPQQQQQQQPQQQWGNFASSGGSSYGGSTAYGSNSGSTGFGGASYSSGSSTGYQGNSSRWNQWGSGSTGSSYGTGSSGIGNSYRGSSSSYGSSNFASGTYQQGLGSSLGGQGGWNKNKRKSGQWKAKGGKKGRWN